jgi:predicted heme/steroid binding protein
MKRILKNVIFFILLTLLSCNADKEVEINFTQLSFDDIRESTYVANGTLFSTNRAFSWRGEVHQGDYGGLHYAITNWANGGYPLWLDFVNGILVLDDRTFVDEDGDYDLYFGAGYFARGAWHHVPNYTVSYNKTTRTLDFSGTYDGHPVYVGIWGEHYITGEWIVYDNELVRDAKLVLTPVFSSLSVSKSARSLVRETRSKSIPNTGSVNRTATRTVTRAFNR